MSAENSIKSMTEQGKRPICMPSSEDRSWSMSHLPDLSEDEIDAMVGLFNCWSGKKEWTLPEKTAPNLVWEYAERHGISGMIGSLAQAGRIADPKMRKWGQKRYFTNLLYHEKCMKICRELQEKAIEFAIPLCVFKGPTLDIEAFQEPGIRSYSDLDILIESRSDAWTIIKELGYTCYEGETEDILKNRFFESGRIHAYHNGWTLEFCYPLKDSCDPMFDVLNRHEKRWLKIPSSVNDLAMPDAQIHLLLLIQHMARHLCSRFIWFLDIVAFVKTNRDQIDFIWIEKELERLQMSNISSRIFAFCRRYIDKDFPALPMKENGWNNKIQETIASPKQLLSQLSMYHDKGWRHYFSFLLSPSRLFFITDPQYHSFFMDSSASRWIAFKLMHTFGIKNRLYFPPLKRILHLWGVPFSFLMAFVAIKGNRKKNLKEYS